jgi:hypothetical protein
MTIAEIAVNLRGTLGSCLNQDKSASILDRCYLTLVQHDYSDEEIVSLWLSVSFLRDHQVPMFVVKHWAEKAADINEWMSLLERHTTAR